MDTLAVLLQQPERLSVERLLLDAASPGDVVVDVRWSGISTGTERLLYTGEMPAFPGMGYPLVPGYESVGTVVDPGTSGLQEGVSVFVPGARCFGPVRGLFGGAAARLVTPAARLTPIDADLGPDAVLLALAATAHHALAGSGEGLPELIVGHGVLGRLLARVTLALGGAPTVWERNPERRDGASGYRIVAPDADVRRDYRSITDVSGSPDILDQLVQRLAPGGEIVLAGFYAAPLTFAFPPAFMREARFRVAAEWRPSDMDAVLGLVRDGRLSLAGLVTHRHPATAASEAYRTAFGDASCLKMVLDWSDCS